MNARFCVGAAQDDGAEKVLAEDSSQKSKEGGELSEEEEQARRRFLAIRCAACSNHSRNCLLFVLMDSVKAATAI